MNIAIIGAGVAGVVSAQILQRKFNVTLIEARNRLGGHTHTVRLPSGPDAGVGIDTGFIVLNDRTYPLCQKFFEQLGVPLKNSDMSFAVWSKENDFYYSSDVPNGIFAQRKRIFDRHYWRFWNEILRFNKQAKQDLGQGLLDETITLKQYIDRGRYSQKLSEMYLLPMGAAIWSASIDTMGAFPAKSFLRFFENHGLLGIKETPQWMTVQGGSSAYMSRFSELFKGELLLDAPVQQVVRHAKDVSVILESGQTLRFDKVVIASHADQALKMLESPSQDESELLGAWRYSNNEVVLHSDSQQVPPVKRAWASWNYRSFKGSANSHPVAVTYYMNRLQRLDLQQDYFVTLNPKEAIPEHKIVRRLNYKHPQYTSSALQTQPKLNVLQGRGNIFYCGSYFGYGFHEDAVRSGVDVAKQLGLEL